MKRAAVDAIARALCEFYCCRVSVADYDALPENEAAAVKPPPVPGIGLPPTPYYGETKATYRPTAQAVLDEITVLQLGPFRLVRA